MVEWRRSTAPVTSGGAAAVPGDQKHLVTNGEVIDLSKAE